ncbi:28635_t:CDS:2, partial [Racocetra persica]
SLFSHGKSLSWQPKGKAKEVIKELTSYCNSIDQDNADEIIELQESSTSQVNIEKNDSDQDDTNEITDYAQDSDTSIFVDTQDGIDKIEYNTLTSA